MAVMMASPTGWVAAGTSLGEFPVPALPRQSAVAERWSVWNVACLASESGRHLLRAFSALAGCTSISVWDDLLSWRFQDAENHVLRCEHHGKDLART